MAWISLSALPEDKGEGGCYRERTGETKVKKNPVGVKLNSSSGLNHGTCIVCPSSIEMMWVSCVPVTCPTQEVTLHSACWLQSQTWGQAIMTSTTILPYKRWYMPPRSGYTWVDNTTPEQLRWTSDTDTIPSMRSPSVAGEEFEIFIQRSKVVDGGNWFEEGIWITIAKWSFCILKYRFDVIYYL